MTVEATGASASPPSVRPGDAVKKWILIGLLVILAGAGYRAWRVYADVAECDRLFLVADAQMEQGKWDAAVATLDRCLTLNPCYFPAYEAKSLIQVDVRHQKREALDTLNAALPHLDGDARLHRAIGEYHLRVSLDYPKAQASLRRACELDPTDLTARGLLRRADAGVAKGT